MFFYFTHIGNTNPDSLVWSLLLPPPDSPWSLLLPPLFIILGVIVGLLGMYAADAFARDKGIDDE